MKQERRTFFLFHVHFFSDPRNVSFKNFQNLDKKVPEIKKFLKNTVRTNRVRTNIYCKMKIFVSIIAQKHWNKWDWRRFESLDFHPKIRSITSSISIASVVMCCNQNKYPYFTQDMFCRNSVGAQCRKEQKRKKRKETLYWVSKVIANIGYFPF